MRIRWKLVTCRGQRRSLPRGLPPLPARHPPPLVLPARAPQRLAAAERQKRHAAQRLASGAPKSDDAPQPER